MLAIVPTPPVLGANYAVDTNVDDGLTNLTACTPTVTDCSLRGALSNAGLSSPPDTITFDASIANEIITLSSALTLSGAGGDTIDGAGTGVTIRGNDEPATFSCLNLNSPNNVVKGLQFTDCLRAIEMAEPTSDNNTVGPGNTMFDNGTGVAIRTSGASGNVIIGNKIGTNSTGTAIPPELGNGNHGILIEAASGNVIGGPVTASRNIVSGNIVGIRIDGSATANEIYGNFIGVDVTGTVDLGNSAEGISITGGPSNNTIGGTGSRANVISGNGSHNISILAGASNNNVIAGNIIGPDINGSGANITNGLGGVSVAAGNGNVVGPGNLISDNAAGSAGVSISGASTSGTVVKGNRIGTNPIGTSLVPNGRGVSISGSAQLSTIGGVNPGDGNVIAFNAAEGIRVDGSATTGNSIRANSIHSNAGAEIDNVAGGNTEPFAPALLATNGFGVNGVTCPNCVVDVFSDSATDARFYEGSVTAAADGTFAFVKTSPLVGPNLTATSTDGSGNTSELSVALVIDSDGDGDGDADDLDDDNDGIVEPNDGCRLVDEDYDSYQDSDGCPEPDNDLDGICDTGQTSVACTGSDSGKYCFDPAGTLSCPTQDCRNIAEDFDAFRDADGCPEPDNDNDGFPDATDDCPGTTAHAGPDGMLGSPHDANHNGLKDASEPPLSTDDIVLTFEDYDTVLNGDGCHDSPGQDFDADGYSDDREEGSGLCNGINSDAFDDAIADDGCPGGPALAGSFSEAQFRLGTRAFDPCGQDAWPSDLVSTGISVNRVNIVDLASFVSGVRKLDKNPNEAGFDSRWDLVPGTTVGKFINISDLAAIVGGATGFPPMLGGAKAYAGPPCPLAP